MHISKSINSGEERDRNRISAARQGTEVSKVDRNFRRVSLVLQAELSEKVSDIEKRSFKSG